VLNAVDCHVELQALEALVCLDVLERFLQGLLRCVAGEGFKDGGWVRRAHFADGGIDGVGAARKQRDGEVAVGWRGEDSSDSCALNGVGELGAVLGRMFKLTVFGPAPMSIANPDGAMVRLGRACVEVIFALLKVM
jgi:hypothetical protein